MRSSALHTCTRRPQSALAALLILAVSGCGATGRHDPRRERRARGAPVARTSAPSEAIAARAPGAGSPPSSPPPPRRAFVTAQTEDRILEVELPSGRVVGQTAVPGDPEYVAATGGSLIAVSARGGTVSILNPRSLHLIRRLRGFSSPHIPAIAPDGDYAYVTDDAAGDVTTIGLSDDRIVSRVRVGSGAHHLAFSPDRRQIWIALGQSAASIVILSTIVATPPAPSSPVMDVGHPHVVGRFAPGFLAHDLLFTPDGRQVWITSADTSDVGVFSSRDHRLLFRVPAGPPPQHVAFDGGFAYITSGYGSQIEQVSVATGRVVRRAPAPYGSFDLDAVGPDVVTASLFRGTLAIYNGRLRRLRVRPLAPSTEDVAIMTR